MSNYKLILGIDIGTSSIKISIIDGKTLELVDSKSISPNAKVKSNNPRGDEQNVLKIFKALQKCISLFPENLLKQVEGIGVCGQMHGIVFWKKQFIQTLWDNHFNIEKSDLVSNLYTWQDARVDASYLEKLPKPKSHLNIYSGYGCSTIFWLNENQINELNKYKYCGTIQDLIVSILCNREDSIMSTHNAASWGYFDVKNNAWNINILKKANFPTNLLPSTVIPGTLAGNLFNTMYGLHKGIVIGVALGDLQCSVLAHFPSLKDAIINISTSAQVAYITNHVEQTSAVAASLNGGNALDVLVKSIFSWIKDLGLSVTEEDLWNRLLNLSSEENTTSLIVNPLMMGERHDPSTYGSLLNITNNNLSVGQIYSGFCKGIVNNLLKMMPKEMLLNADIKKIIGTGTVIVKNSIIRHEIEKNYHMPLIVKETGDAAFGAALSMVKINKGFF
ncbi:sedoheptulokinase-like isoform X2 [Adelges cooleyi]|uniref:sedoheptulokinase-like isoform X2 n=1 Tax=Adelges cooleyi TaxID=133065 RepID=UPI0021803906|nr:sedoheptulokinase-like isoform X2 [Adelges cooleyi]